MDDDRKKIDRLIEMYTQGNLEIDELEKLLVGLGAAALRRALVARVASPIEAVAETQADREEAAA